MTVRFFFCLLRFGLLTVDFASLRASEPPRLIAPHIRPSLKELGARLQKADEISALYRESLKDPSALTEKKLSALEKPNRKIQQEFRGFVQASSSFVRGEIEDETVLGHLVHLLQLSLLRLRLEGQIEPFTGGPAAAVRENAGLWFRFAADLPFNEASLVGLKVTGVVRSLVLDELERLELSRGAILAKDPAWLPWLMQLPAPWPVDRMLLTESKRLFSGPTMALAEKVAAKIQKNPYLSVEKALSQIPGGKPKDVDVLKKLWREEDMESMKAEINRLQTLRLKLAARMYEQQKGTWPTSVSQLIEARFLSLAPVDYLTGRPMALPKKP